MGLRQVLLSLFCFLPLQIFSLMQSPWYSTEFEWQSRAAYLYQYFPRVATKDGSFRHDSNGHFAFLSLGVPYYDWYFESELCLTNTHCHNFGIDNFSLMARYQVADDISAADPVSVVISGILSAVNPSALKNIGSFHHGRFEGLCTLSIGKEIPCSDDRTWHLWAVAGIGIGDRGSPWLSGRCNLQYNSSCESIWEIFAEALYGFGEDAIKKHFKGYGAIQHRSFDFGAAYSYEWECGPKVTLSYARRVYARNFPEQNNRLLLSLLYPFNF